MTRADQILLTAHTRGQVRRAAQQWCSSMTRDHRADRDEYRFTDGSLIVVTRNITALMLDQI